MRNKGKEIRGKGKYWRRTGLKRIGGREEGKSERAKRNVIRTRKTVKRRGGRGENQRKEELGGWWRNWQNEEVSNGKRIYKVRREEKGLKERKGGRAEMEL